MRTSSSIEPPCADHATSGEGWLDRLATWLERSEPRTPVERMLDLAHVVDAATRARLHADIVALYETPLRFRLAFGMRASWWSRWLLSWFARVSRQLQITAHPGAIDGLPVCQFLYRDARGRVRWDRYVQVDGRWRRLFIARMAARTGAIDETFVIWGLPVALRFRVSMEPSEVVLTLMRTWSPLSWWMRVEYRTLIDGPGLQTRGSFRIPSLGLRVDTDFRATRR